MSLREKSSKRRSGTPFWSGFGSLLGHFGHPRGIERDCLGVRNLSPKKVTPGIP